MHIRLATNAFAAALAVAAIAILGGSSHAPAKAERLGSTASYEAISSTQSALASAFTGGLAEPQTQGPHLQASFAVTRLTDDPNSRSSTPAWSPDGSKIAFQSDRGGNWDIYVMDADGSNVKQITDSPARDMQPAWSPDGSKIAYQSNPRGNWDIYVMDTDGSNIERITELSARDTQPAWSPDGSKIAFASDRKGFFIDIFIMDADGSNFERITDTSGDTLGGGDSTRPAWSPDGSKIAYSSNSGGRDWNVLVMDADGSNIKRITDRDSEDFRPEWSPDGSKIAYSTYSNGSWHISVVDADGSNNTRVTDTRTNVYVSAWSPDGSKIAFDSFSSGTSDIFVVNVEPLGVGTGSGTVPVTPTPTPTPIRTPTPTPTPIRTPTPTPTPSTDADADDRAVLRDLFNAAGGNRWTNERVKSDWRSNKPLEEWRGVETEGGRVVGLYLGGIGLTDRLPVQIGELTELRHLNLSGNSLTGALPDSLRNLKKIETILLADNDLTGCVPDSFRNARVSDIIYTSIPYCGEGRTPKPMPESPEFITWHIGDAVRESEERAARIGVLWLKEFAPRFGWIITGEDLTIDIDTTARLVATCKKRFWESSSRCDGLKRETVGGLALVNPAASKEGIFIKASESDEPLTLKNLHKMAETAIHEQIHSSFQYQLRGYNADMAPLWIVEGMATYFAAFVVDHQLRELQPNGPDWLEGSRSDWVECAMPVSNALSNSETNSGSGRCNPRPDSSCEYDCGALAIQLLASMSESQASTDFFVAIRRTLLEFFTETLPQLILRPNPDAWHAPFQAAFGISVPEFYKLYEERRAVLFGTQITHTEGDDYVWHVEWSPDGERIAYILNADDTAVLYVAKPDGSEPKRVFHLAQGTIEWSPDGTWIALTSDRDGTTDVYVVRPDGTDLRQLTHTEGDHDAWVGEWSPDGTWLSYDSNSNGTNDVYVVKPDGSGRRQLSFTTGDRRANGRAWSPDGTKIAFHSNSDGDYDIYVAYLYESKTTQITNLQGDESLRDLNWSPDGNWIAFTSDRDGNNDTYVMKPDGSDRKQITETRGDHYAAAAKWTPDGNWIVIDSNVDGSDDVYLVKPDGPEMKQITFTEGDNGVGDLEWSSDGTRVAFNYPSDGSSDIFVADVRHLGVGRASPSATTPTISYTTPATFTVTRLTDDWYTDYFPTWSPDSTRIAFTSNRLRDGDVYVMDADGSNITSVARLIDGEHHPAWSPDGTKIAFDSDYQIYVVNADGRNIAKLTRNDRNFAPAWSPDGLKIAFTSDRDGDWDIFVMDADGSNIERITDNRANDNNPAWSPDGTKIAFQSNRDGSTGVFTINPDGSDVRRVTNRRTEAYSPSWAPDGSKIMFQSIRDSNPGIFIINPDGSGIAQITRLRVQRESAAWSPDGTRIAFASDNDGVYDMYVVNVESLGIGPYTGPVIASKATFDVTRLTDHPADDFAPSFSPDGTKVAFNSDRNGVDSDIHVVNADGSNPVLVADMQGDAHHPAWSPDGSKIAFDVGYHVWVVNPDGSNITQLTKNSPNQLQYQPAWSPDGRKIAFTSRSSGRWDIHIMDADGSNIDRVTNNRAWDNSPAWSPDGTKIAFISNRDDDYDMYIMDADGSNINKITESRHDNSPSWSPDGTKIAFISDRDGEPSVYVVNADGSDIIRVTDNRYHDGHPAWSLDGTKIAFNSRRDGNWDIYVANVESLGVAPGQPLAPPLDDRAVLTAFYNATNGGSWTGSRNNWLSARPLNQWEGVSATTDGTVVGIDLPDHGLSGAIPAEFGQLSGLKFLNLSANSLTGDVTESLGDLTDLDTILLAYNEGLYGCVHESLRNARVSDIIFTSVRYCDEEQTPKPMPETPSFVKWHIDESVPESEERAVKLGVQWLYKYADEKMWFRRSGPLIGVTVLVNTTWPSVGTCLQRWTLAVIQCIDAPAIAPPGFAGHSDIFIKASGPEDILNLDRLHELADVAIHENIHSSFQLQLMDELVDRPPFWYLEGMAVYFAAVISNQHLPPLSPAYTSRYEYLRNEWVRESLEPSNALRSAETELGCSYQCGPLAIELLAPKVESAEFVRFHRALLLIGLSSWRDTFRDVFGMTVTEFYEMYEQQRINEFQTFELTQITHTEGESGAWLPRWSPDGTRIAFNDDSDGNHDVYVVAPDGSGLTQVTHTEGESGAWEPRWSPDGTRIAFRSDGDGTDDVYVVNLDGSGLMQLTHSEGENKATQPRWSPDGTRIAFTSRSDGTDDVYVVNPDGSGLTQVTHSEGGVGGWSPHWSPDGTRIAFISGNNVSRDVYVVNPDGSSLTQVTHSEGEYGTSSPQWSPDGTRIAFYSDRDGTSDVYVVNLDGSGLMQLTHTEGDDNAWDPRWSPDGTRIAFVSGSDDVSWITTDVYVVNPDGAGLMQVTHTGGEAGAWYPRWSPDGTRIAFVSNSDGIPDVYVVNVEANQQG